MSAPLSRAVLKWLQSLDLTYAVKQPKTSISNGFIVAEIASRYYSEISLHSYSTSFSKAAADDNWEQLMAVFRAHKAPITQEQVDGVKNRVDGAAEEVLTALYTFLVGRQVPSKGGETVTLNELPYGRSERPPMSVTRAKALPRLTAEPTLQMTRVQTQQVPPSPIPAASSQPQVTMTPQVPQSPVAMQPVVTTHMIETLSNATDTALGHSAQAASAVDPRRDRFSALCAAARQLPMSVVEEVFTTLSNELLTELAACCCQCPTDYLFLCTRCVQTIVSLQCTEGGTQTPIAFLRALNEAIATENPSVAALYTTDPCFTVIARYFTHLRPEVRRQVVDALLAFIIDTPAAVAQLLSAASQRYSALYGELVAAVTSVVAERNPTSLADGSPVLDIIVLALGAALEHPGLSQRVAAVCTLFALAPVNPTAALPFINASAVAATDAFGAGLHHIVVLVCRILAVVAEAESVTPTHRQAAVDALVSWAQRYAEIAPLMHPAPAAAVFRVASSVPACFPMIVSHMMELPPEVVTMVFSSMGSLDLPDASLPVPRSLMDAMRGLAPFFQIVPPCALIGLLATAANQQDATPELTVQTVIALEAAVAAHASLETEAMRRHTGPVEDITPSLSALSDHLLVALSDAECAEYARLPILFLFDRAMPEDVESTQTDAEPVVAWTVTSAAQALSAAIILLLSHDDPPAQVQRSFQDLLLTCIQRGGSAAEITALAVSSVPPALRLESETLRLVSQQLVSQSGA